jgi:hypothetical protein
MREPPTFAAADSKTAPRRRRPRAGTWIGAVVGVLATVLLLAAVIFGSPIEPWFLAPITCLWIRYRWDVGGLLPVCPFFEWLVWGILVDLVRLAACRRRTDS